MPMSIPFIIVLLCLAAFLLWYSFRPAPREIDRRHVEALVTGMDEDNGAKYYLMAWLAFGKSLGHSQFMAVRHYYHDPEKRADHEEPDFRDNIPQLEEIINNNADGFQLIREGSTKPYFEFPPEPRINNWYAEIVRDITNFMVVRSAVAIEKKDSDNAVEADLEMLRFATGISQNKHIGKSPFSSFAFADHSILNIEKIANLHLRRHVRHVDDLGLCQRLIRELLKLKERRASARELMEKNVLSQTTPTKSVFQWLVRPFLPRAAKQFLNDLEDASQQQLDNVDKSFREIAKSLDSQPYPFNRMFQGNPIYGITRGEADCRATIIVAALRAYLLMKGSYPEGLEELESIVPDHVLIDPFPEQPFRYKKMSEDYLLYSVGPDLLDDGGKEMDPHSAEVDGDIVY
jgi:hypothetical protein